MSDWKLIDFYPTAYKVSGCVGGGGGGRWEKVCS